MTRTSRDGRTPLPLVARAQRDDEHVAVLKVDERAPEIRIRERPGSPEFMDGTTAHLGRLLNG